MSTTSITRIAPEDIVAMNVEGFYALRSDCLTRTELDAVAYEESEAWLAEASERERAEDPTGQAAYERAYDDYASSADNKLYAPVGSLLQETVRDSRLSSGYGVSTGNGRASMTPYITVEVDGADALLADSYPGAYESLHRTLSYA